MSDFLDYLDKIQENNCKGTDERVEEKVHHKSNTKENKSNKVLSINVEVRTPDGARHVIEKLEEWIERRENTKKVDESRGNRKSNSKGKYKIPPKKVVKSKIKETTNHAMNILDGLPEEPEVNTQILENQQNNINSMMPQNKSQPNLDTVSGHASALL